MKKWIDFFLNNRGSLLLTHAGGPPTVTGGATNALLLETGDHLLLENGNTLGLE